MLYVAVLSNSSSTIALNADGFCIQSGVHPLPSTDGALCAQASWHGRHTGSASECHVTHVHHMSDEPVVTATVAAGGTTEGQLRTHTLAVYALVGCAAHRSYHRPAPLHVVVPIDMYLSPHAPSPLTVRTCTLSPHAGAGTSGGGASGGPYWLASTSPRPTCCMCWSSVCLKVRLEQA